MESRTRARTYPSSPRRVYVAISSPLRFESGWSYTVITTGLYNTNGVSIQAVVDRTAQ